MRETGTRPKRGKSKRPLLLLMATLLVGCDESPAVVAPTETNVADDLRASVSSTFSIKRELRCPSGGTIDLRATPLIAGSRGALELGVNATLKPERCRWTAPEGPIQLDAAPNLVLQAKRAFLHGKPDQKITGTLTGKASWTLRGQTVNCRVDANFRIDVNHPLSPTITGSECEKFLIRRLFLGK